MQAAVTVVIGGESFTDQIELDVVAIDVTDIRVSAISVETGELEIDEGSEDLNAITMEHYFGPSIAALREVGEGLYRTSVERFVPLTVSVEPAGFAPLMELRIDGEPVALGASTTPSLTETGTHLIAVGPPATASTILLETYDVTITSHEAGDEIPNGTPVLFTAETDPPGYEDDITWLSSTKYGSASPVLGQGPMFAPTFLNTFGEDGNGGLWEWKGVKAGPMAFGQDQKVVIDAVLPLQGPPGTIINVQGSGFGNNPLGCCLVLKQGNRMTATEVLTVQDDLITARIEYVPPDADGVPQEVGLRFGDGQLTTVIPDFPDVVVEPDQWIWNFDELLGDPPAAAAPLPFVPTFVPPPSGTSFHSGPPQNGVLCVTIDEDWGQGTKINLYCRVHQQGTGSDTNFNNICFTLAGSRFDCAVRICNIIVQQMASHPTRPLFVNCTVTVQGGNAKITVSLPPPATMDQGTIDIVVK